MNKLVVSELSSTQRVVVEPIWIKNELRIEIRKEWRRNCESDWSSSKGITIPAKDVNLLIKYLIKFIGKEVKQDE